MKDLDRILNQLKDSHGELITNAHMLDEIVPVEEQMKYFQYAKYIAKDKDKENLDRNYLIARLFTPEVNIEDKRYYLSVLAGIVDVAAYRAIEAYHSSPLEPGLTNWSALALTESKILLDAEFSGQKQFFVSTGLGGKNRKLRYFSVIATNNRENFSDFQKEIFLRELHFQFEHHHIEIETLQFKGNYLKIIILCGLNYDARLCVQNAIDETNDLGHFIDDHFLLTNVKQIDDFEIVNLLMKKEEEKKE
ncbi:MAG: hypothetical protein RL662_1680 [Bacteroidota bacterium]|jgi:hypothetical protein